MMTDDLTIPDFLRREMPATRPTISTSRQRREKKIPYPRDGYLAKGMREEERERLRATRRRHAERVRVRRGR